MAMTMHCDIVSAEKELFSGRATMVVASGELGELGVMPGHAPLLTRIRPGPVRVQLDSGEESIYFASGGYVEVQPDVVTVLADTVVRAEDVDEAAALEAKERAEKVLENRSEEFEYSVAAAQLAEAAAQLRVRRMRRGRGS